MRRRVTPTTNAPLLTLEELVAWPFRCVNCFEILGEMSRTRAYCSECCAQEAEWVRYARRCRRDGRDQRPDVKEAIRIKLALAIGGGYPKLARQLPDSIRKAVRTRDQDKCQKCGRPGTEIDHIAGNSSTVDNLQLLCNDCHNAKTIASFTRITKESHPEAWAKRQALVRRAIAPQPLQLCDADDWGTTQRELIRQRTRGRGVAGVALTLDDGTA